MIYKGNLNGKIILIGECLGEEEAAKQQPFVGESGKELHKMLAEAGISISDCLFCNVLSFKPKTGKSSDLFYRKIKAKANNAEEYIGLYVDPLIIKHVEKAKTFLRDKNPNVIIALGNIPLWALTGLGVERSSAAPAGITKWRGSVIYADGRKVIPTYNPAGILRAWDRR